MSPNVAVECLAAMLRIWRSWIQFSTCTPAILTAAFRGIPELLWTNASRAPQSGQRKLQPYFQFTVHLSQPSRVLSASLILPKRKKLRKIKISSKHIITAQNMLVLPYGLCLKLQQNKQNFRLPPRSI